MKTKKLTRFLAMTAAIVMILSTVIGTFASANSQRFTDVPSDHWAAKEIQNAVDNGITKGYADGTFKPAASVTNAHFAAFLARAFYASEIDQSATPWYAPYTNVLNAHGILTGDVKNSNSTKSTTAIGKNFDANINQPINRYDMAAMMYNVLLDKGIPTPDWRELHAVMEKVNDWDDIPSGYKNPVAYCYALGVLKGQSNGAFGGYNLMNRAQACVVIYRLAQKIGSTSTGSNPSTNPGETTAPSMPAAPTAPVTPAAPATPATPAAPASDEHVLTNGKPITEDNVLEIIEQIKKDYPEGAVYAPVKPGSTPEYYSDAIYGYRRGEGGCNGWAAMCSDLIFGQYSNNKSHEQKDHSKIRPGDIIESRRISNNKVTHYSIVVTANDAFTDYAVDKDGNMYPVTTFGTSDSGRGNNVVSWPKGNLGMGNYEEFARNGGSYWVVWTRYPD